LSTDKKNFETKKPHARKLFPLFFTLFAVPAIIIGGATLYLWLCWWLIGLLVSLSS
jgi:hypothetical protein